AWKLTRRREVPRAERLAASSCDITLKPSWLKGLEQSPSGGLPHPGKPSPPENSIPELVVSASADCRTILREIAPDFLDSATSTGRKVGDAGEGTKVILSFVPTFHVHPANVRAT